MSTRAGTSPLPYQNERRSWKNLAWLASRCTNGPRLALLNDVAWMLATDPNASIRRAAHGIRFAAHVAPLRRPQPRRSRYAGRRVRRGRAVPRGPRGPRDRRRSGRRRGRPCACRQDPDPPGSLLGGKALSSAVGYNFTARFGRNGPVIRPMSQTGINADCQENAKPCCHRSGDGTEGLAFRGFAGCRGLSGATSRPGTAGYLWTTGAPARCAVRSVRWPTADWVS